MDLKSKLPAKYIENMTDLLGDEALEYFESFEEEPIRGLRVNLSRISDEDYALRQEFNFKKVPWTENGYYVLDDEAELSKCISYHQGLYYIQEPSAMSPAAMLPLDSDDIVLDLCAAPGGKATQLASRCRFLFANDISATRANALLKNLENAGLYNIAVTVENPSHLADCYQGFFDKILVDAPCSGEGMFRRQGSLIDSWMERGPEYYHELQVSILNDAYRMLKEGGLMLYSTCTFSDIEDEQTIIEFIEKHPDMTVVDIPLRHELFEPGKKGITKAARLYPHKLKGEGHFIALMQKGKNDEDPAFEGSDIVSAKETAKDTAAVKDYKAFSEVENVLPLFFDRINSMTPSNKAHSGLSYELLQIKDKYILRPKNIKFAAGVRFLRTGLLLGEDKKGRFSPLHPLALALKKDEYKFILDLKDDADRAIRYLKGETIFAEDSEIRINNYLSDNNNDLSDKNKTPKTFDALIIYKGITLGFGRINNGKVKNMYPASWVMR